MKLFHTMFFDVQFADSIISIMICRWDEHIANSILNGNQIDYLLTMGWEQFANRQRNIWISRHSHQWIKLHTQIAFKFSWFRDWIFRIYSAWSGQIIDDDYHYGGGSFNATWALKHFLNNECYFLVGVQDEHRTGAHSNGTEWNDEMKRNKNEKNEKNENINITNKAIENITKWHRNMFQGKWKKVLFIFPFCCTRWETKKWKSFSFTSCRRANTYKKCKV